MLKQCRALWLAAIVAVGATATQPVWAQQPKQPEQTWTVNFKDSDIHEVIKFVADITGKTIVIDSRVKGRITVLSREPKNKKELYGLFRSVLEVSNYTVVEVGDVVRIVPIKDARTSPISVVSNQEKLVGDDSEYVTEVIQLKNVEAAKVLPVLRPLIPQHSHFAAYSPSNAIVVSDTIANIERVRSVIERIDQAALPTTEIIQLKYAGAEEMVATLKKLTSEGNKQGASASSNSLVMVSDKRNNAVLLSGEDLQRERIKELIRRLDRPQQQTGNVRVIYLEYAKAKEVAEVLTKVVQNMAKLKPGGDKGAADSKATVEADEATNALLLTASGDMLSSLLAVVERLDVRRAQVLIEAIIVEIDTGDGRDFGIEWLFQNQNEGVVGASGTAGSVGSVAAGVFDTSSDALTNLAAAMLGVAAGGQSFAVGGDVAGEEFLALATFLESDSRTNILSTPTLLTLDNNEASISVGKNVPFVTGSFTSSNNSASNPFQTIQREDVGINLTVTPHINAGDQVVLEISQEISSLSEDGSGTADVVTNQSKVKTQVLAKDGSVIILGGMIQEQATETQQRVPVLGRIPLMGRLFRSSGTSVAKKHIMIFIHPTIIRDDETLMGATAEKYRRIREDQIKQRDKGLTGLRDSLAPVLPALDLENLDLPAEAFEGSGVNAVESEE